MTLGVKLLATTLGVIGGGGVITPLTLWQTGYIGRSSSTEATSSTHHADSSSDHSLGRVTTLTPQVTSGTCEVKDKSEFSEMFRGLSITDSNYTVISCENTGSVLKKWTGIFPDDVFDDEEEREIGKQLDMKTDTQSAPDDSQERYRTTFSSREWSQSTLEVEWGTEEVEGVSKVGSKFYKVQVRLEEQDDTRNPLYLVLPE